MSSYYWMLTRIVPNQLISGPDPQPADLRPRAQLVQYFHSRAGTWNPVGFLCVPINTWWPGLYDANHNGKANKNINTGTTSIITTSLDINDCTNLECERSLVIKLFGKMWFQKYLYFYIPIFIFTSAPYIKIADFWAFLGIFYYINCPFNFYFF